MPNDSGNPANWPLRSALFHRKGLRVLGWTLNMEPPDADHVYVAWIEAGQMLQKLMLTKDVRVVDLPTALAQQPNL